MIAANDHETAVTEVLTPDQLRRSIAMYAGLLAHHTSSQQTVCVLQNLLREIAPHRTTMAAIAARIVPRYGLTVPDIRVSTRRARIVVPRQHAMWEMHEAGFSNRQIGGFFGGLDASTVTHGRQRHADRMSRA